MKNNTITKLFGRVIRWVDYSSPRKTGLALGGGAVLGAAHIGVLKALEEYEVQLIS